MEDKTYYVVRLTKIAYQGKKEPTEFLAEAKQYDSQNAAVGGAPDDAIGVSEYKLVGGKPVTQKHFCLATLKAESVA